MDVLTRFFVGFLLLLNGALACLELSWFDGSGQTWALVLWVVVVALYDSAVPTLILGMGGLLGCLYYLFFPIAMLVYFAGKFMLYSMVFTHSDTWLVGLTFVHAVISGVALCLALFVNPTWENMNHAIVAKWNWLLAVMLLLRVRGGRFREGRTLGSLMLGALHADNPAAVRGLLRHGAVGYVDDWMRYAKSGAVKWLIVKSMLDRGKAELVTPFAADFGVAELRYCLQKGVDPKTRPQLMHSAIEEQSMQQHDIVSEEECQSIIDKLQLLLDHGVDVETSSYHHPAPLVTALILGVDMTPVIRFLLTKGARVNTQARTPIYPDDRGPLPVGHTPLMIAVTSNRPGYIQILLEHGADIALRDADGKTALDYAAEGASADALTALLTQATRK